MADLIGIVEAAYEFERDEYAWLRGMLEEAAPFLDRGLGAFANSVDVDARMRIVTRASVFYGLPATEEHAVRKVGHDTPPELAVQLVHSVAVTMSQLWGAPAQEIEHHRDAAVQIGAVDFLGVVMRNPTGPFVLLGAPLPEITRLDDAFIHRWERIAAHVAAAARMRLKLGAIVAPDTPELVRAAEAVERARGPLRHEDPDAALDAWRPLVGGRWSLFECTQPDGTRGLVARENAPDLADDGGDESTRAIRAYAAIGHSARLIAYELDLPIATVEDVLGRRPHG